MKYIRLFILIISVNAMIIPLTGSAQSFGVRGDTYHILERDLIKVMQKQYCNLKNTQRKCDLEKKLSDRTNKVFDTNMDSPMTFFE